MTTTYRVVIKGVTPDKSVAQVAEALSPLFKVPKEKLIPLLQSSQFVVKRGLDLGAAAKYEPVLRQAGCICVVEPDAAVPDGPKAGPHPPKTGTTEQRASVSSTFDETVANSAIHPKAETPPSRPSEFENRPKGHAEYEAVYIENAKNLRKKIRIIVTAGFAIFGFLILIDQGFGAGIGGAIFLSLFGYVIGELSRIFIKSQRDLSKFLSPTPVTRDEIAVTGGNEPHVPVNSVTKAQGLNPIWQPAVTIIIVIGVALSIFGGFTIIFNTPPSGDSGRSTTAPASDNSAQRAADELKSKVSDQ